VLKPRSKVEEYLLALGHPVGSAKARYLIARGCDLHVPEDFENDAAGRHRPIHASHPAIDRIRAVGPARVRAIG
jgi:hypothetical protein